MGLAFFQSNDYLSLSNNCPPLAWHFWYLVNSFMTYNFQFCTGPIFTLSHNDPSCKTFIRKCNARKLCRDMQQMGQSQSLHSSPTSLFFPLNPLPSLLISSFPPVSLFLPLFSRDCFCKCWKHYLKVLDKLRDQDLAVFSCDLYNCFLSVF